MLPLCRHAIKTRSRGKIFKVLNEKQHSVTGERKRDRVSEDECVQMCVCVRDENDRERETKRIEV